MEEKQRRKEMRSVMKLLFENYFTTVKFPKFEREEEERRTYDLFEKSLDEIQKKLFLEWESGAKTM